FLHRADATTNQDAAILQVNAEIRAFGFDVPDLRRGEQNDPAVRAHRDTLYAAPRADGFEQRTELVGARVAVQVVARAIERAPQPFLAHRLQQVIQRMDLEGFDRVRVVGRDEDHGR